MMGAINYGTSRYITIGDPLTGTSETSQYLYQILQAAIDDLCLKHFSVSVRCGYYDGTWVDIDPIYEHDGYLDDYKAKREATKEATQVGKILRKFVRLGLRQVFPGWCTGVSSKPDTLSALQDAIKDIKDDIRTCPTWYQITQGRKGYR